MITHKTLTKASKEKKNGYFERKEIYVSRGKNEDINESKKGTGKVRSERRGRKKGSPRKWKRSGGK